MTDSQYRTITFHILEINSLLEPIAKDSELDSAPIRCRAARATMANIIEVMIEAEREEDVFGRSLHLAYDVEPSVN